MLGVGEDIPAFAVDILLFCSFKDTAI